MYTINHDYSCSIEEIVSTHRTLSGALRTIARRYRKFSNQYKSTGGTSYIFPYSLRDQEGNIIPWATSGSQAEAITDSGPNVVVNI